MSDDIVERLRDPNGLNVTGCEAADEIERLRALIIEWDDAERAYFDTSLLRPGRARAAHIRAALARIALRREVGR